MVLFELHMEKRKEEAVSFYFVISYFILKFSLLWDLFNGIANIFCVCLFQNSKSRGKNSDYGANP